jgi:TPP-dependent pyruvate/acetoin dehydrogenase alpha subunit
MKRYPMFDPPEYVDWRPAPEIMEEYVRTLQRDPERAAIVQSVGLEELLAMYAGMVRFRHHDITLHRWVKQGVISKAWLGTGEEAVTIGSVHALNRRADVVGPMIRNAGACHEMGISLADMLRAYLATSDSPGGGKDFHIGNLNLGVIAPVSQLGDVVPVFAGIGLAFRQRGEDRVALTWVGDGATKTTPAHEGLNLAAVLKLPVIYVFQNNQVALGTRFEQHQKGPFTAWANAYGTLGFTCAGNNVLDVYAATKIAADLARRGKGPSIIFAETFRMGGHATHDEQEARSILSPALFDYWGKRDPIGMFETYLQAHGVDVGALDEIENSIVDELKDAEKAALASRDVNMPSPDLALRGVYAD